MCYSSGRQDNGDECLHILLVEVKLGEERERGGGEKRGIQGESSGEGGRGGEGVR